MGKETFRQTILVADDSEMNRSILADMLGSEFEIKEAENGSQALEVIGSQALDLVLLDTAMPIMDGFQVLEVMKEQGWLETLPVIMIVAENMPTYVERAYDLGVNDCIRRPFEGRVIRQRLLNTIMLYAKEKRLAEMVDSQVCEKEKTIKLMVDILSHVMECRSSESDRHVLHIRILTELLLRQLVQKTARYGLEPGDILTISYAAGLHDIGKISIPEEILNKPGPLTEQEFEVVKTHAAEGAAVLESLQLRRSEPLIRCAYEICRWHHERYDGRGYPDRLVGEEIPISAQVVALADVYDALTRSRVYQETPYSHEQAIEMIQRGECGAFPALLLECLAAAAPDIKAELKTETPENSIRREIWDMPQEERQRRELTASDRTLRLLERERTKYRFFASMSKEIQFEYIVTSNVLTISEWGAHYLGIGEIQVNPYKNKVLGQLIGRESLRELANQLRATVPERPIVEYGCAVSVRGERRWGKLISRAMWSGDEPPEYQGAIGKFVDIHEEHRKIEALEQIASHDGLTNLLNRDSARKKIEALLAEDRNQNYALIVVDLDHFKEVNDRRGHLFGDQVLKHVADKLRKSIRSTDLAARVGGDEFLVFVACAGQVKEQTERIFHALSGQFEGLTLSVSMGIAQSNGLEGGYEMLFRRADQALYAAKGKGRNCYFFYDDSMREMLSVLSPIESDGQP